MSELWRLPQGKGAWISSRGQRSMAKDPAKSTRLFLLEPQDAETLPRQAEAGQSKVRVPGPIFGASSSGRSLAVLAKRKATKTWSDPPVGIGLCSRSCPCPASQVSPPTSGFPLDLRLPSALRGHVSALLLGGGTPARPCLWTCFPWPER